MSQVSKVLVANRGEIACRIMRTLSRMDIAAVAVYSRVDADSLHVRCAPEAAPLADVARADDATGGYLSVSGLIGVALAYGCDAVHPGYGFLAENAEFARACVAAGLTFIGPSADAIEALGDKAAARAIAVGAAVPVVPGVEVIDEATAIEAAAAIGYPILIKPVAGGGGKGMHVAGDATELADLMPRARREASAAFGDDRLILERFLPRARHIEVQVLADNHGQVRAIGDRECTLQRRHQKVIEEAPAPHLSAQVRASIHAAAEAVVLAVGYANAGTVEFVVSAQDESEFYFLEVNTRLQVEHPVTEEVLGIDLVQCQVRVACGEALDALDIPEVPNGCSFEARVYAEDPDHGFLPTGGRLAVWDVPSASVIATARVRVDAAVEARDRVSSAYDPMIAKVITWAPTRNEARVALADVLRRSCAFGVVTNTAFLVDLLRDDVVVEGRMDTRFIERFALDRGSPTPDSLLVMAWGLTKWADAQSQSARAISSGWRTCDGWRMSHSGKLAFDGTVEGAAVRVDIQPSPDRAQDAPTGESEKSVVQVSIAGVMSEHSVGQVTSAERIFSGSIDGQDVQWAAADITDVDGAHMWILLNGRTWIVEPPQPLRGAAIAGSADSVVTSPMPGTVVRVSVAVGDSVEAGAHLLSVEAMKMEHALVAPYAGVVSSVTCAVGAHVKLREVLVMVEPNR